MEDIVPFQSNDVIIVVDGRVDIVAGGGGVVGMDWMDKEPITDSGSCNWLYCCVNVFAQDLKAMTVYSCNSNWYSCFANVHLVGERRLPSKSLELSFLFLFLLILTLILVLVLVH